MMNNTEHHLEMVRESYSNDQAITRQTQRVKEGLRNCEQEIISHHFPPHVHIRYQGDMRSYRLEIQNQIWLKPGRLLPPPLRRLIEAWVDDHKEELLEQWDKAQQGQPISIVG